MEMGCVNVLAGQEVVEQLEEEADTRLFSYSQRSLYNHLQFAQMRRLSHTEQRSIAHPHSPSKIPIPRAPPRAILQ